MPHIHRPALLALAALLAFAALLAAPSASHAQDGEYTIGLFVPDIVFADATGRASFVQDVASALSARTGLKVRGLSFARDGDLKSNKDIDFAIVSGTWYASSGFGTPVAWATGDPPLALLGKAASSVYELKGKTLILPRSGNLYEGFLTATLLDHEIKAKDFFKITFSKDVQSALAAVKLGQADATVAFQPYAAQSGLAVLYTGPPGPLPVVVQVNDKLDEETANKLKNAFQGLSASGGGLIQTFGGGGRGLKAFRGAATSKPAQKRPVMAEDRLLRLSFDIVKTDVDSEWERTGVEDLVPLPDLPPQP